MKPDEGMKSLLNEVGGFDYTKFRDCEVGKYYSITSFGSSKQTIVKCVGLRQHHGIYGDKITCKMFSKVTDLKNEFGIYEWQSKNYRFRELTRQEAFLEVM